MQMRFFRIPVSDPADAAGELNRFLAAHRVVSVDRELVEDAGNSAWAVCVTYVGAPGSQPVSVPKGGRIDYREVLSNEEFAVFARLRNLRKTLAEAEGVPVYAVFTNEQLAAMVTQRATAEAAIAAIAGVGEARRRWERRYNEGRIDERGLQAGYDAARAITAHADAAAWRRAELRRRPPRGACALL